MRNRAFKFFASVKLAVVLLAVLIVGAIFGTIYESSFDAKVARAYVYGAPWFNIWLILLGTNLAISALSRWPWKKHHTAFLVTHLGIITLLTGSLIGRIWGTEGTITLFKGDAPTNRLLVDQHQLRVHDIDGHYAHARKRGAEIVRPPADFPYGERQYTARDPGGGPRQRSASTGASTTLSWTGTDASYYIVSPEIGAVRGNSTTVHPTTTTTYTLYATNQYGRQTKTVTVTVQ